MKIRNYILLVFTLSFCISFSQSNLLNAKVPSEIGVKSTTQLDRDDESVLDYGYIDDKDVLFSKTIWELIDLNERVNFPFLYPTDLDLVGQERRPLIYYLLEAIKSDQITEIYEDSKFNDKKIKSDIVLKSKKLNKKGRNFVNTFGGPELFLETKGINMGEWDGVDTDSMRLSDIRNGTSGYKEYLNFRDDIVLKNIKENFIREDNFTYDMVTEWLIKGVWYFDKIQSDLRYRPIAIAPVTRQTVNIQDDEENQINNLPLTEAVPMFWIFYRDARETLKNAYVFSEKNSSVRKSFDELINARRFNSMIYMEENVQSDRPISEYITKNSFMQLLESERIREKIRNFEHDMWSW